MTGHSAGIIDSTAQIADTAILGNPFRPLLDGRSMTIDTDTTIGSGVWVGHYVTIGQGVTIGRDSIIEDYAQIQPGVVIGSKVLVTSRARIGSHVTISDGSIVKGHVDDNARIGRGCRVAGDLIHRQLDPSIPWDDPTAEEPAPSVGDGAFVGWNAVVVGGVNIGAGSYVCSGALITRDVPDGQIAFGRNQFVQPGDWPGVLGKSPFFQRTSRRSAALFGRGRHS
jgi:bifunctional UDP-N-acetylglucosamine pyrophosphorylase/glucosamine-1-phosphate N-acetyltransferase